MANGGVISAEGLTPKLQAFADAYMSTAKFNGTEAARQAQYKGNDKTLQVVASQNLSKPIVIEYMAKRFQPVAEAREIAIVNTHAKNAKFLRIAEMLVESCEDWLLVNGKFELGLRDTEMEIVYTDPREKTALKWPKQRKGTAAELIEYLEGSGKIQVERIVSQLDIRKYILQVLKEGRETCSEIAKIQGDYTNPKNNAEDTNAIAKQLAKELMATHGKSEEDAVAFAAKRYGVLESELLTKR